MVVQAWMIRARDEPEYDCAKIYEGQEDYFSLCIHHGGEFSNSPERRYRKGEISYVDFFDIDCFSIIEFNEIMVQLGYDDGRELYYHFLRPGSDIDFGLHAFGNDADCLEFAKYIGKHKLMHVYVEHGITKLDTYFSPTKSSGVVIKEIDDTDDVSVKQSKASKRLFLEWHEAPVIESNTGVTNEMDSLNLSSQSKGKGVAHEEDGHLNEEYDDDFFNFDPFLDHRNTNLGDHTSEKGKETEDHVEVEGNVEIEDQESDDSGDDSQDSDYMVDKENEIIDVEVDMTDINLHIDEHVEFMGSKRRKEDATVNSEELEVEVINNEEFDSGDESGGDEIEKKRAKKLKELKKQGSSSVDLTGFYVGQVFSSSKEVKEMIKKHAVDTRRDLKLKKNDKTRVRAICMGLCPQFNDDMEGSEGSQSGPKSKSVNEALNTAKDSKKGSNVNAATCPWSLLVSKLNNDETWKTYLSEHNCLQSRKVRACTADFLSQEVVDLVQSNPSMPVRALQDQLQKKFQVGVSKMKAFRAKEKATVFLQGDHISQYSLLRDYCMELKKANPGSTIKIDVEASHNPDSTSRQFRRIYVCLGPLKDGFKACKRDFLGLDGAFMKGPFPGQILTAVGLDANNGIYPLAYAIIEAETKDSWTWFLECLGDDLDLNNQSNFTFISDRQKGILPAIERLFPCAEHRYCIRHIHENFKQRWKGKAYKELLWRCGTALTVHQFEQAITGIPCKHVVAVIWNMSVNGQDVGIPEAWVHQVYWLKTWQETYSFKVGPINGRNMWPQSKSPITLTAPKHHKQVGRPRKKRRRGIDEIDSLDRGGKLSRAMKSVTCGKCKEQGHNSRTCKGEGSNQATVEAPPPPATGQAPSS